MCSFSYKLTYILHPKQIFIRICSDEALSEGEIRNPLGKGQPIIGRPLPRGLRISPSLKASSEHIRIVLEAFSNMVVTIVTVRTFQHHEQKWMVRTVCHVQTGATMLMQCSVLFHAKNAWRHVSRMKVWNRYNDQKTLRKLIYCLETIGLKFGFRPRVIYTIRQRL